MTERDLRGTTIFEEVLALLEASRHGGEDPGDPADISLSADTRQLLFTGTVVRNLAAPGATRVCQFDLATRAVTTLTAGPNSDRGARMSPDGATIAFVSDRQYASDFQLFLFDTHSRMPTAAPKVDGWIEYLSWSPDGRRILLGVADHGAELPSGQGATQTAEIPGGEPGWMPRVIGAAPDHLWRRVWVYDRDTGVMRCVSSGCGNVWEASWCGNDRLVAVMSDDPGEGDWYAARLAIIEVATGVAASLYRPLRQIALPRTSPSGRHVAFIEAVSSDREYVAGDIHVHDLHDGSLKTLETNGVDVTALEWISDDDLLLAGYRGLETVVARANIGHGGTRELWASTRLSTPERSPAVVWLRRADDFALVSEGFFTPPLITTVAGGILTRAEDSAFDPAWVRGCGEAEQVRWHAPDGLEMEGWLLRPRGVAPYPTILDVHGGPVLHWRPYWLARLLYALTLLQRGFAIFLPNPRGSSGRGQDFAARVVGDVAGADTADYLSGIDHLVGAGIADPDRLGVTGLSYGGFMTCWLTTQDTRFAAAVAVGPSTNHVSHHLTCNIPQYVRLFLGDDYTDLSGMYYSRSPVLHAHRSRTPTLLACGDLDRCTPAAEAIQFHNALLENGVASCVVRYPEEGHGILGTMAAADFAARCASWFETYIPAPQ